MKPIKSSEKLSFYSLFSTIVIVILSIGAIVLTSPPKVNSKDSNSNEFSAERAFEHIKYIAQNPHMTGSAEHDVVCSYIVNELERIGLEVDIQNTTIADENGYYLYANVTNIVGKIRGKNSSKALLIAGHYDTQPYTPGAADDGLAVGSMLEAAEILKNHCTLENDIIFLFTDAEEIGLLGAEAFVREHPWMKDVGLVLNLEARGNRGPVLAFEVSQDNGWLIREFVKSADRPFAASMMYEVYKMLPNNTDFTIFKNNGVSGINFALVKGFANYHSPTDTPQNLSLKSLQHMGNYVMSLAKHFGNIPLYETKGKDLVYFNIIGHKMIYYPAGLNFWLLSIVLALLIFFFLLGFLRKQLTLGKLALSFFVNILTIALVLGAVWGINYLVKSAYPHYNVFYSSNFYNVEFYFLAFSAITISIFLLIFSYFLRKVNVFNVIASVFVLFTIISIGLLLKVPTASYILLIPLLSAFISLNTILFFNIDKEKKPIIYFAILIIGLSPTVLILSPYIDLLFDAFGLDLPIASVVFLSILLFFILPLINEAIMRFKHSLYLTFFGIAILFLIIAHSKSQPTVNHPLQSNVVYAMNNDLGKAFWLSWNHETDKWNDQFFEDSRVEDASEFYPWRKWLMLKADADTMQFERPQIQILEESKAENIRIIEFKIKSNLQPTVLDLVISNNFEILSFSLDGIQSNLANNTYRERIGYYYFRIFNPHSVGHDIKLEYKGDSILPVRVFERLLGLPNFDYIKPMPLDVIQAPGFESSVTLVANNFEL